MDLFYYAYCVYFFLTLLFLLDYSFNKMVSFFYSASFIFRRFHYFIIIAFRLVFKEMLATPENPSRNRLRKASSDFTGNLIFKIFDDFSRISLMFPFVNSGSRSNDDYQGNRLNRSTDDADFNQLPKHVTTAVPALSGRERVKQVLYNLINKHRPNSDSIGDHHPSSSSINSDSDTSWDPDMPEHSLKIYKADQQSRYLLVHKVNTIKIN